MYFSKINNYTTTVDIDIRKNFTYLIMMNALKGSSSSSQPPLKSPQLSSAIILLLLGALATTNIGYQSAAAQEEVLSPSQPPLTLKTNNESVNVVVNWEPQVIEPSQNVKFTLDFQHPFSGESLAHVNYNLEIMDEEGNTIESITDLHTHAGNDVQTVTFDRTGSFKLVVTILGTGINPPFDTTRSGSVETALMVVPEFPIASVILAAGSGLGIAIARMRMKRHG